MKVHLPWPAISFPLTLGACALPVPVELPAERPDPDTGAPALPTCQLDEDGRHEPSLQALLDRSPPGAVVAVCGEVPIQGPVVVRQDVTLVGPATLLGGPGPALHVAGGAVVLRELRLVGGTGSPEARLGGDTHGGVLAAWDADALTLDSVEVSGGVADWGGCLTGPRSGPLLLRTSRVDDCEARKLAGAIWMREGVLEDSLVRNGRAPYGGGVAARTVAATDRVGLPGSLVERSVGSVQGGGLLLTGPGEVWGGSWVDNRSQQGGGALVSDATGIFRDAALIGNEAEVGGGGLFVSGGQAALHRLELRGNRTTGEGLPDARGVGGGIWVAGFAGDRLELESVELIDNEAAWGAGLLVAGPEGAERLPVVSVTQGRVQGSRGGAGIAVVAAELRLDEVDVTDHAESGVQLDSGLLWARGGEWRANAGGDVVPAEAESSRPGAGWLRCTATGCAEDAEGPAD